MTSGDDLELKLIAYVANAPHGFALPVYGQNVGANTFYSAKCHPNGDHLGRISTFEVFDTLHLDRLPDDRIRTAKVGDPWLDVFLWDGSVLVGTAPELWSQLSLIGEDLRRRAPLSLLDAAINARSEERFALALAAVRYLNDKHGESQTQAWRTQTLNRYARTMLGRLSPRHAAVALDVKTQGVSASIELSKDISAELSQSELADLKEDLTEFSRSLGLNLKVSQSRLNSQSDSSLDDALDHSEKSTLTRQTSEIALVLALGVRAREIARHIGRGIDWIAAGPTSAAPILTHRTRQPTSVVQVVTDDLRVKQSLAASYKIAILLVDDDLLVGAVTSHQNTLLRDAIGKAEISILAPALPELYPSRALTDSSAVRVPELRNLKMVLDTAQARSPFWRGAPKRSFTRRLADIVTGTAICCATPQARALLEIGIASDEKSLMLFAGDLQTTEDQLSSASSRLSSESTWLESDEYPVLNLSRGQIKASIDIDLRSAEGAPQPSRLQLRPFGADFEGFAAAFISSSSKRRTSKSRFIQRKAPAEILHSLRFPTHAAAFSQDKEPISQHLLVVGEAPTIESLKIARRLGWQIVRYTDQETLRTFLRTRGETAFRLPKELDIGAVLPDPGHRRLAVRGVDGRDVVRLPADQILHWLDSQTTSKYPSALKSEVRPLRTMSDVGRFGAPKWFVLRRQRVASVMRSDDLLTDSGNEEDARLLNSINESNSPRNLARPYKRASDLEALWVPPSVGLMRFAVADGKIPTIVAPLQSDEVVLQEFFVIDGDWSAPALLRSSIFSIWASATLTRSNSWMSRFSVGSTFSSLPLPRSFRIQLREGGGLAITSQDSAVLELSEKLESDVASLARSWGRKKGEPYSTGQVSSLSVFKALDSRVRELYGIKPDADDLDTLMHLIDMGGDRKTH